MKTGGIFKNSGTGCVGCAGLGSFTTGIFAGPTALGRPLYGLGAFVVPANCWDVPGFKACSDQQFRLAQVAAEADGWKPGTTEYDQWVITQHASNVENTCMAVCNAASPTTTTPATPTPKTPTPAYTPPVAPAVTPVTGTTPATTTAAGPLDFLKGPVLGLPLYGWLIGIGLVVGVGIYSSNKSPAYGAGMDY